MRCVHAGLRTCDARVRVRFRNCWAPPERASAKYKWGLGMPTCAERWRSHHHRREKYRHIDTYTTRHIRRWCKHVAIVSTAHYCTVLCEKVCRLGRRSCKHFFCNELRCWAAAANENTEPPRQLIWIHHALGQDECACSFWPSANNWQNVSPPVALADGKWTAC